MTYKEETYVLDTLKKIRADTEENNKLIKENNIMLKQLCNYFSKIARNSDQENIDDFVRNILANLISTQFELFKRK